MENTNNSSNRKSSKVDQLLSKLPPPTPLPSFVTDALNETKPAETNISDLNTSGMAGQNFHTPIFSKPEETPDITMNASNETPSDKEEVKDEQGSKADLFNWMKGSGSSIFSMVAEKAKSSVDAVLTTLDPQMKDTFNANNIDSFDVVVATEKEIVVSAVREGFQKVFGKFNVRGLESPNQPFATQLVGFTAASQATKYCIDAVRIHVPKGPIVAYERFIVEPIESKWYEFGLLKLNDMEQNIDLEIYTQSVPVPSSVVRLISDDTPKDYEHLSTGFSIPVANFMASNLKVHPSEWQEVMTGISHRSLLLSAAISLAMEYKNTLE
ncbi:protein PRRC1-like isoform X2 [Adelges cooleyi]|uniref:protein PRRC1-like isoform X2 n=1 Tax=Adelges cooleyi TaxID=133065 RepID=UPI002180160D|nr:protein PRRC1-like isoform X2 [Adelges cooleyi]